jgi:hypothetical protein
MCTFVGRKFEVDGNCGGLNKIRHEASLCMLKEMCEM